MKVTFRTQFDEKYEHFFCPEGEMIEMRHRPSITKEGRRILIKDRAINVHEMIQSHKEECEIENIIRRAIEGDYNALNSINGTFADITNCPSSIAEAQQYIINAKEEFNKLPKDVKAKFEYNAEMYIAEMANDTENWLEKTGFTEKVKLRETEAAEKAKVDQNFAKAMEFIASGQTINNPKGEVDTNE